MGLLPQRYIAGTAKSKGRAGFRLYYRGWFYPLLWRCPRKARCQTPSKTGSSTNGLVETRLYHHTTLFYLFNLCFFALHRPI